MSTEPTWNDDPRGSAPSQAYNKDSDEKTIREDVENDDLTIAKTTLEIAKLKQELKKDTLEERSLTRQLSWQGTALEWIKAGTVLAALIGIATTLYIGQRQAETAQSTADRQSKDAEESRAADRFDKALSRLAERDNPGARMSGVAGLRLFLIDSRPTHQREALHYLVTLLGEEKSPEVQQVFLDAFTDARLFTQEAKDDALRTAIEIDRSLTEVVINQLTKQKESAKQALLAKYLDKKIEDLPSSFSYSYNNVISLTFLPKNGIV
jgi:hypothetical protein